MRCAVEVGVWTDSCSCLSAPWEPEGSEDDAADKDAGGGEEGGVHCNTTSISLSK